jgi:hypothetical protein
LIYYCLFEELLLLILNLARLYLKERPLADLLATLVRDLLKLSLLLQSILSLYFSLFPLFLSESPLPSLCPIDGKHDLAAPTLGIILLTAGIFDGLEQERGLVIFGLVVVVVAVDEAVTAVVLLDVPVAL